MSLVRFAVILVLASAIPVAAQDAAGEAASAKSPVGSLENYKAGVGAWLQFRGDLANTGVSHSKRPDYANMKQAWKYFANAALTSTPAVAAGRVIAATEEGVLHAIDAETGRGIWRTRCGPGGPGKGFVFSSPMILNGRVYAGTKIGALYCLDFESGEILWNYQITDVPTNGKPPAIYSSPKGDERGIVFSSTAGFTYCVDPVKGTLNWKARLYRETGASAAILGDRIYVSGKDRKLRELSYADGSELRSIALPGTTHATPALGLGFAYLITYRESVAIDLIRGEVAWTGEATSEDKMCAAVTGDQVYFPLGQFVYSMGPTNGRLNWKAKADHKIAPPIINGDEIIFTGRDGILRIHDRNTGKEIRKFNVGEGMVAGPVLVDGTIYVATDVNKGVHVFAFR